jgi:hypothetical protein
MNINQLLSQQQVSGQTNAQTSLLPLIQKFLSGEFGRDEKTTTVDPQQQLIQQRPAQQPTGTSLALNQVSVFRGVLWVSLENGNLRVFEIFEIFGKVVEFLGFCGVFSFKNPHFLSKIPIFFQKSHFLSKSPFSLKFSHHQKPNFKFLSFFFHFMIINVLLLLLLHFHYQFLSFALAVYFNSFWVNVPQFFHYLSPLSLFLAV